MHGGGSGAVYGLGLVGALIYFVVRGDTPRGLVFGLLKALVWPAIFVLKVFEFLKV